MYLKKTLLLSLIFLFLFSNLLFAKQVTFKGKVIDSQGNLVRRAKATLYNVEYMEEKYTYGLSGIFETSTDDIGEFRFTLEANNEYPYKFIIVEKEGMAMDCITWYMNESKETEATLTLGEPKEFTGIVIDENDNPIQDAQVSFVMFENKGDEARHSLNINVAPVAFNTKTGTDGKFSFTDMPANAKFELLIQKEGHANICTYTPGSPVEQFFPGKENVRFVMQKESIIEGTVIDHDSGEPIKGVDLFIRQGQNSQVFGQDLITSNDDGTIKISGLSQGNYSFTYAAPRQELTEWVSLPSSIIVKAGEAKKDVKVELSKGGMLEVFVTEAGGNEPIEGASVGIYSEQAQRSYSGKSDKDGIAKIRLLPGSYDSLYANGEGYSSSSLQNGISIVDGATKRLEVSLGVLPKATGIVRDLNGKPIEGVILRVLPGGGRNLETDEEGKFEISWDADRIGDGSEVPLLVCRYEEGNLAKVVNLEGNTSNLDIKLDPGITLVGKVTDPEGNGINKAKIRMMLRQTMWSSTFISGDNIKTDEEGNLEVKAIPAEHRYELTVRADGYGDQKKSVHADDAANNILDSGTFTLPVANLSISGIIVDADGNPVPDARISTRSYDGGQPDNVSTQTDSKGNFVLKGVCEGRVDIRVNAVYKGVNVSARATADGGTSDIRIIASERGEYVAQHFTNKTYEQLLQESDMIIAGVVVDENNSPIANVPVGVNCIKREQSDNPGKYVWSYSSYEDMTGRTDKQGRFVISIKEDAEYDLIVSPYSYAAQLVYDVPAGKKDLKVVVSEGGTISGRLLKMVGTEKVPIGNVEIKLEQTSRASYTHLGFDQDKTTVTDSQGRFKFERIRTKIRPSSSRSRSDWEHEPRIWQLVYGDNTKTLAFYEGPVIENFEFIIGNDLSNIRPLQGKSLPDFEGIKIDFDKDTASDKSMLVCFFDIEQRPSRSCILELNKQVSQLEEKGIKVIAVHAAKVESDYLNSWLKENDINFPVGTIETSAEQIKSNWGVNALPWLILTDKEHVVTNEGFSVSEIGEKIK